MTDTTTIQQADVGDNRPRPKLNEAASFYATTPFSFYQNDKWYSNWSAIAGAGGIMSTPTDLVKFYKTVFGEKKIISLESIRLMLQFKRVDGGGNYGFGVYQVAFPDDMQRSHVGFGHNGRWNWFYSQVFITPQVAGTDPLVDKYVIYAQACQGHNSNFEQPIVDMKKYMYTGKLEIPQLISPLDEHLRYDRYVGSWTWTGQGVQKTLKVGKTEAVSIDAWNDEKNKFNKISRHQLYVLEDGQTQPLALMFDGVKHTYKHWPGDLRFVFGESNDQINTLVLFQSGGEFTFLRNSSHAHFVLASISLYLLVFFVCCLLAY